MHYTRSLFLGALVAAGVTQSAEATVSAKLDPFTGRPAQVQVDVENDGPGTVTFTFTLNSPEQGDIAAIFLNINNDALLPATVGINLPFVGYQFASASVSDLGGKVDLSGGGVANPGKFDFGIELETPGTGTQTQVVFSLLESDPSGPSLDESFFRGEQVAVVVTGLGPNNNQFSKLSGTLDNVSTDDGNNGHRVPESRSSVMLLGLGLLGLVGLSRKWSC